MQCTTADFISGLYKSIPPLNEMFDMAGMQLPKYLGEKKTESDSADVKSEETSDK